MKRLDKLPTINTGYNSRAVKTEAAEIDYKKTSHQFTDMLNKFNLKKKRKKAVITEEKDKLPALTEIEEDRNTKIKNQKFLIKLYTSEHKEILSEIKDELEDIKKNKNKKETQKETFTTHKFFAPNPGFQKFNSTVYSNEDTMKVFYEKFQNFKVLNRKQPLEAYTPSFAFIKGSNEEMILPNPLGLVKRRGEENKLELNNQKLGDRYMKVLSKSLAFSSHISSMHLKGNRLTSLGTNNIIYCINNNNDLIRRLETLDLSDNLIGQNDISELIGFIKNTSNNLENLNLANNRLGNTNVINICDALGEYAKEKITKLDLGNNCLTKEAMPSICQMLVPCRALRVLRLNNNKFDNKSATDLFKTLLNHLELRVLDLSWNNIGTELLTKPTFEEIANAHMNDKVDSDLFYNYEMEAMQKSTSIIPKRNPFTIVDDKPGVKGGNSKGSSGKDQKAAANSKKDRVPIKVPEKKPSDFAKILGEYFHCPLALIHLDISHNSLPKVDCELIAKEIKDNHYVMGVHVDGNEMYIDSLGFIHPISNDDKDSNYFANSQIYYELTKEYDLTKTSVDTVRKIRNKNNCWICDGWREVQFEFTPKEPVEDIPNHLAKLHLSCDNYKPFDMIYKNGKYEIIRMCPPGEVTYFFTFDTLPVITEEIGGKNKVYHLDSRHDFEFTFDSEYIDELNNIRAKLYYEYCQREKAREEARAQRKLEREKRKAERLAKEAAEKAKREEEERIKKEAEEKAKKEAEEKAKKEAEENAKKEAENKTEGQETEETQGNVETTLKTEESKVEADETKDKTEIKTEETQVQVEEKKETVILEEEEEEEVEEKEELTVICKEPNPKEIIKIKISDVGRKTVLVNHGVINEVYRKTTYYTEPRPEKIINRFVKPRTPWTYPVSIWNYYGYEYEGDPESYIDQCFEFDFARGMYIKDVKDDEKLELLKEFLRSRYTDIVNTYKSYSSRANTELFQITLNLYTEFINNCPGLVEEDKNYNANFINLKRQVAYSNAIDIEEKRKGNKNLCDNLVRHQFMSFLVKVAIDKYVDKFKTISDPLEAVKFAFQNHYDPAISGLNFHKWRKERYYNEKVDNYLKAYLPILDAVYKSWASRKTPNAKDVWMEKKEFDEFVQNFVDVDEYPIAQNSFFFNISIRLQINEINQKDHPDRHMIMFLPEFLEGLCRTVDLASPMPPGESDWPKEKRDSQLLIDKLENSTENIIRMIKHPDYKYLIDKFPRPAKDFQTGLYKFDYESPYYQGYIIKNKVK